MVYRGCLIGGIHCSGVSNTINGNAIIRLKNRCCFFLSNRIRKYSNIIYS